MADYGFVTSTGVIVPDTATLQTAVENEWREAFGADLVVTADTPQGVLITAEVLARDAIVRNNAALANQINPDLAGGVFLDAIWKLTGGQRIAASYSLVTGVQLNGVPNTIIPEGVQASVGPNGDIFESTGTVQLDASGQAFATFQALEVGPVAAPVGDLDTIVSGVLGWETITNPSAAVLGVTGESDLASRRRRRNTLALQTVSISEAIVSGLFDTPGVRSVLFRENVTNADLIIEGYTLEPHSVFACVQGGTDADVAATLLRTKSAGAAWNGDEEVDTVDPVSGQTYTVKFQRPEVVEIYMQITVRQGSEVSDPETLVRAAVEAYAAGELEGEAGFVIGADVSPWEIGGAINRQAPGLYVQSVGISLTAGSYAPDVLPITILEQARVVAGNIEVLIV